MKYAVFLLLTFVMTACNVDSQTANSVIADDSQAQSVASELKIGMTEAAVTKIVDRHKGAVTGANGGAASWATTASFPDGSVITLYYKYESMELREKGSSELKRWNLDPIEHSRKVADDEMPVKAEVNRDGLTVLPWPERETPIGVISNPQLVSLPLSPDQCKQIIANSKRLGAPDNGVKIKDALEAYHYFMSHLNMAGPPAYMAIYEDSNHKKHYFFSGGQHWGNRPLFSEIAILFESGEIREYRSSEVQVKQGNEAGK